MWLRRCRWTGFWWRRMRPGWLRRRIGASGTNLPGWCRRHWFWPGYWGKKKKKSPPRPRKTSFGCLTSGQTWETDKGAATGYCVGQGLQAAIQCLREEKMAQDNSFDIVSKVEIQEVRNAI